MRVLREIARDTVSWSRAFCQGQVGVRPLAKVLAHDGLQVLILSRVRQAAVRWQVPLVDGALRRLQTALFGVELSEGAAIGEGVMFVHTVGVVVGGDAQIGDRVTFLGMNTVGTIRDNGYPRIGNDVVVGAGARILGPIRVGDGASIGANAVVVHDVPAGATAVGVPAVVRLPGEPRAPHKEASLNGEHPERVDPSAR